VYAESTIAGDRLPAGVYEKLGRSNAPIGRVLIEHHVSIRREALGQPREAPGEVDRAIDAHIGASSFSRAYRIVGRWPAGHPRSTNGSSPRRTRHCGRGEQAGRAVNPAGGQPPASRRWDSSGRLVTNQREMAVRDVPMLPRRLEAEAMARGTPWWRPFEELVPKDGPAPGDGLPHSGCGEQPSQGGQPHGGRSTSAACAAAVMRWYGRWALANALRYRSDATVGTPEHRRGRRPATAHGNGDALALQRVHQAGGIADQQDPPPRRARSDHSHLEPAPEMATDGTAMHGVDQSEPVEVLEEIGEGTNGPGPGPPVRSRPRSRYPRWHRRRGPGKIQP